MIVAELIIYNSKKKIDNKTKETEHERELILNNGKPKMIVENITLERDLRSSYFDSILDEINCPKDFAKIIKTLDAKPIKKWQSDIAFLKEININIKKEVKINSIKIVRAQATKR